MLPTMVAEKQKNTKKKRTKKYLKLKKNKTI